MSQSRSYTIEPANTKWTDEFRKYATLLQSIFGKAAVSVEHVGSTAVPGLNGKPTLDILIITKDIAQVDTFNAEMVKNGFDVLGEYVAKGGRLFKKDNGNTRLVNVHVFEKDHENAVEMIVMRDYLRTHPDEVERYGNLKKELFAKHPDNYSEYRTGKDPYLQALKRRAFDWKK